MRNRVAVVACGALFLSACSSAAPMVATVPVPAVWKDDPTWSEPTEYRIDHPTEEAGEKVFEQTGLGDPYKTGVPYPIFLAMLDMHPEVLGDNLQAMAERFGLTVRQPDPTSSDRDLSDGLPMGLHLTVDPNTHIPFVVHNCSLCHADVVRWPGGEKLVMGLANRHIRVHAFEQALAKVSSLPDFNKEQVNQVATRIAEEKGITWPMNWRRRVVIASIRGVKEHYAPRVAFLERASEGLPGRVATIESFAVALEQLLHRSIQMGSTIGWAKIPDTIGFANKRTLSWDGGSDGPVDALVVGDSLASGGRLEWLYKHPLEGSSLSTFMRHLPRELPFPGSIDRALAGHGKVVFEQACAKCHGTYEDDGRVKSYVEKVVPLDYIDTDPARALAVTDDFVAAANDPKLVFEGPKLVTTRRTSGYVPPVLTSTWARAPYGHAGQWPTLAVLAMKPALRPTRFLIHGNAPLDLEKLGLPTGDPSTTPASGDYIQDGFEVSGHPFLADLGLDARAVLEYLKTL